MENDSYFNILSLDGGGIKGLYTARVLEHFEEKYKTPTGKSFDLICGTSTGGLICLALAQERSAKSNADFYSDRGEYIFPYAHPALRIVHYWKSVFFTSKYNGKSLRREVSSFLGSDIVMGDLKTDVCIPAYNINTGQPVVFKKSSYPDFYMDHDVPVVDVALATSAAPTYFPIHEICGTSHRDGQYIDGGIWANDPSSVGVLEAVRYLNPEGKKIRVISISAFPTSPAVARKAYLSRPAALWGSKIFDFAIQSQLSYNARLIQWLANELDCEYYRINPEPLSGEQETLVQMDLASPKSIDLFRKKGKESGINFVRDNHTLLQSIFKTKNI